MLQFTQKVGKCAIDLLLESIFVLTYHLVPLFNVLLDYSIRIMQTWSMSNFHHSKHKDGYVVMALKDTRPEVSSPVEYGDPEQSIVANHISSTFSHPISCCNFTI